MKKRIELIARLLKRGGYLILNIGGRCKNKDRSEGDYNHNLLSDMYRIVSEIEPQMRWVSEIIWDKGEHRLSKSWRSIATPMIRSQHEYVIIWQKEVFKSEEEHLEEKCLTMNELKEYSRSVWQIHPTVKHGEMHPCAMPDELCRRLVKLYVRPKQVVLEPWAGAFTVCKAAQQINADWIGIDINPNFCELGEQILSDQTISVTKKNFEMEEINVNDAA